MRNWRCEAAFGDAWRCEVTLLLTFVHYTNQVLEAADFFVFLFEIDLELLDLVHRRQHHFF